MTENEIYNALSNTYLNILEALFINDDFTVEILMKFEFYNLLWKILFLTKIPKAIF